MSNIISKSTQEQAIKAARSGKTIRDMLPAYIPEFQKALSTIPPERFTRLALSAISLTPLLAECTPQSFFGSLMLCAQMDLEPNTPLGHAYLIPYRNGKTGKYECQFQLGYKGLIELAYRSGKVKSIYAEAVYEKDKFQFELGEDRKLVHIPYMDGPRGKVKFYYAVWKGVDGASDFCVMSVADIQAHKDRYSKAKFSPWSTNFDEMAKKTCLKRLLKYAPLSIAFQREVAADETVKTFSIGDVAAEFMDKPGTFVEAENIVEDTQPALAAQEEPLPFVPSPEELLRMAEEEQAEMKGK